MKKMTVKQIREKLNKLRGERQTWETHWQEIADYIFTRKNTIQNEKSPGQKRTFQLLDNTAMHSNELLAGMLHGLLTNPDLYWFEFTTGNLAIDSNDNVRRYLQDLVRLIHNTLNNSNFQTEAAEFYLDLGSFGIACQYLEPDDDTAIRFSTKFIKEYLIDEDRHGRVNQLYREWKCSPAEVVQEFGESNLPEKLLKMYRDGKDSKVCVVHAVYPKYIIGEAVGKAGMTYISQYVLPEMDHEISTGQYKQFPYVVARWSKASGEVYGRSPGMNALPEIKVLNKMNETMLIGAQKMVDPPIQMPDDGFILPIVTKPGGINYYRAGSNDIIKPIFNTTNIDFGYNAMEDRRQRVRDAFFVDQLKLRQGGPMMTATEVLQRTEEATRLLGPVLGRMQSEYLRPMIERVYSILVDRDLIPPAPAELNGRSLDVRYSSLIAKSQRISEGQNINRTIQAIAPFLQVDPSVADNFNGDNAVRVIANIYGLPQEILRDAREVQAIRDQRVQAAQAQIQAQQEAQDTQVAASLLNQV